MSPQDGCDICGGRMNQLATLEDQRYSSTPTDEFCVFECQQCGVGKTDPIPSNLSEYYIEEYYENRLEENNSNRILHRVLSRVDQTYESTVGISSLLPEDTGELLVVGCGPGHKLSQYKRKEINVIGVEPNKEAVQFGRENYDVEIKHGSLTDEHIIETLGEYDAILFDHVFEHIPNPRENLAVARDCLRPTGSLIIEVPNFDSWSRQLFGRYWGDYDVPRHIYHYTPASLKGLLSQCGFKLDKESYDLSARLHSFWFAKLLKEKYRLNFHGRIFYPIFGIYGIAGGLLKKTRFRHRYKIE